MQGSYPSPLSSPTEAARYTAPSNLSQLHALEGIYSWIKHLAGSTYNGSMLLHFGSQGQRIRSLKKDQEHHQNQPNSALIEQQLCFDVLQTVGLDIHGGTLSLYLTLGCTGTVSYTSLSMSYVLVRDPKKARQYFSVEVHIVTDIPECTSTLAEAADAFSKVSVLVRSTQNMADIISQVAPSPNEPELWRLKREKFGLETRERRRQILLEMAREKWPDEQVSSL
jgi:hypothetical protein